MATRSKRTKTSNLVVDKSSGRELRIMEDSLKMLLTPYISKLSKDRNWYSPLIALIGVVLSLIKFDYYSIIKLDEKGVAYVGVEWGLLIVLIVYICITLVLLFLFGRSLYYIWEYRKEDLSEHGIVDSIISMPTYMGDDNASKEDDNNV